MAISEYKSSYTGNEVDTSVSKAQTSVQQSDILNQTGNNQNKVMSQWAISQAIQGVQNGVNQNADNIQAKATALNSFSNSLTNTYSANYANSNFAQKTLASTLFAVKQDTSTAILQLAKPTISINNILSSTNTTNTEYDWTSPEFTFKRTLESITTLNNTNSFIFTLPFTISRDAIISWGARIKVSQDNEQSWTYISGNQAFGALSYETGVGNTSPLVVYTNGLDIETTYNVGDILAIEIYKKQAESTALTTNIYCGVEVDDANIFTFVQFNFGNIEINTTQIMDGAVTLAKINPDIIDDTPTQNSNNLITSGGVQSAVTGKLNADINACTTYAEVFNILANNNGVGICGIGLLHTGAIKSLLPTLPISCSYVDCQANLIKNKYEQSLSSYIIRFIALPIYDNLPLYYCDVHFDNINTYVSGWYKPQIEDVIYDKNSSDSNINWGYTGGIPSDASINVPDIVDFSLYKYAYAITPTGMVYIPLGLLWEQSYAQGGAIFPDTTSGTRTDIAMQLQINKSNRTLYYRAMIGTTNQLYDSKIYKIVGVK